MKKNYFIKPLGEIHFFLSIVIFFIIYTHIVSKYTPIDMHLWLFRDI